MTARCTAILIGISISAFIAFYLAHVLEDFGMQTGDRIGSLCWNNYRHLELYFAVPCAGGVLHTLNPRLAPDQLAYIINHAEDHIIFVDASLASVLDPVRAELKTVRHVVVLDEPGYEALLAAVPDTPYAWPALNENAAAAMCYTSGTTGNPKGVVYSHRAVFLHNYGICMADSFALSERDTILQLVPMFHANGWGTPYAGIMTGSCLVLPGRHMQPADIGMLIQNERVAFQRWCTHPVPYALQLPRVAPARHFKPAHGRCGGCRTAAAIR